MAADNKPCPDTPNCVNSQDKGRNSFIQPIPFKGDVQTAKARLIDVIKARPRAKILHVETDYLHASFTSLIFRFVDDVEFWFDEQARLIQVRSASRVGYYDLGVNRRRVERLRRLFEAQDTENQ